MLSIFVIPISSHATVLSITLGKTLLEWALNTYINVDDTLPNISGPAIT